MKTIAKILIVLTLCFSFASIVKADSPPLPPRPQQTTFYFQQNGQPVTQPVKFNMECYKTFLSFAVSELSQTCSAYGCKFDTTYIFQENFRMHDYCNLEGEVNGQKFTVNNFLGDYLSELSCSPNDYVMLMDGKYYKETPRYNACRKDVYREYYPHGNGDVSGYFICHKSLVEVTKNDSTAYNYVTINNILYKFTSETYACIAEKERKMQLCDQYLEIVPAKVAEGSYISEGSYIPDEICEAKVNIPDVSNTNNQQTPNVQPVTPTEQPHKNIFSRIINFFRCTFLKIFGKSC